MSGNVIDKAIERLHEKGWSKRTSGGWVTSGPRSACMVNSILAVQHEFDLDSYYGGIAALKVELGAEDIGDVYAFNDDPSTSLEDVLLVMKKASARLDEAQSA